MKYKTTERERLVKKLYWRSKNGLVTKIYSHQKQSSKKRGYPDPNYSKEELKSWMFSQKNFETLYNNWVNSGYKKALSPSVDRIDDYKSYTLNNIQLMTFKENKEKSHIDIKNGINNKKSKSIRGIHIITGEIVEFYSTKEAERQLGIGHSNISGCFSGRNKSAGGYKWMTQ